MATYITDEPRGLLMWNQAQHACTGCCPRCRTPGWGKTNAINTAADKTANGSLPVPIKKAPSV
eukprot:1528898-Rhodomonas_salina.1